MNLEEKIEEDFNYSPFDFNYIRNRVDLEESYTYYNHVYFDDTLTPVDFIEIRWNNQLYESAGMCIKSYKGTTIELNPIYLNIYPEEFPSILVHEMIHLITIDHDQKFIEEAERITNLGLDITVNCKHNLLLEDI